MLVLGLLLLSYLFTSLLPDRGWAGLAVVTVNACTFLAAVRTSRPRVAVMRAAAGTAVVAVGVAAVTVFAGGGKTPPIVALLMFGLLLAAPFIIIRRILSQRRVTYQTLAAAVDVYLLIGLIFASLYRLLEAGWAGPFFAQVEQATPNQTLYFSFVTLATLGYGDLTPATDLGRTIVVVEAILGQVFLVTAVARAVSLLGMDSGKGGGEG